MPSARRSPYFFDHAVPEAFVEPAGDSFAPHFAADVHADDEGGEGGVFFFFAGMGAVIFFYFDGAHRPFGGVYFSGVVQFFIGGEAGCQFGEGKPGERGSQRFIDGDGEQAVAFQDGFHVEPAPPA